MLVKSSLTRRAMEATEAHASWGDHRVAISLYDISVGCYLQALGGLAGFLEKGLDHFKANGVDPAEIIETRLFPDMHPFRYQVQSVVAHSKGAVDVMKAGVLTFWQNRPAHDYAQLQALVADARNELEEVTPKEINALAGGQVLFEIPNVPTRIFTTEGFVLSFSLPNVHFHATTAYDILRMKGVPVGKRDYMGPLRLKN